MRFGKAVSGVVTGLVTALSSLSGASAFVGPSYLMIPEWAGDRKVDVLSVDVPSVQAGWVRMESSYWDAEGIGPRSRGIQEIVGPAAPTKGERIALAVDKDNPMLPKLMASCAAKSVFPEVTFAESSYEYPVNARLDREVGLRRPENTPAFYKYKLVNAQIVDCPVVADAREQAVVLKFSGIDWLNVETAHGHNSAGFPGWRKPTPTRTAKPSKRACAA